MKMKTNSGNSELGERRRKQLEERDWLAKMKTSSGNKRVRRAKTYSKQLEERDWLMKMKTNSGNSELGE